jgi:hypothetical protein
MSKTRQKLLDIAKEENLFPSEQGTVRVPRRHENGTYFAVYVSGESFGL